MGMHWSWLMGRFVPDTWQGYVVYTVLGAVVVFGFYGFLKWKDRW